MLPIEKQDLLSLFADRRRWCQQAEARDAQGNPIRFSASAAVSWDITGALCRLFGWSRACILFGQLERHLLGGKHPYRYNRVPEIDSMVALQVFNDQTDMTFETLLSRLASIPVWRGRSRRTDNLEQPVSQSSGNDRIPDHARSC